MVIPNGLLCFVSICRPRNATDRCDASRFETYCCARVFTTFLLGCEIAVKGTGTARWDRARREKTGCLQFIAPYKLEDALFSQLLISDTRHERQGTN